MPQDWRDVKETVFKEWLAKPRRGLLTDVDGTLSPIVDRPEAAEITPRSKILLTTLQAYLPLVAVISGRAAADVQARVGIPGIVYAGNHGLERWQNGQAEASDAVKAFRPAMQTVLNGLSHFEQTHPGVMLEDKGVSLSVHYRQATPPEAAAVALRPVITQLTQDNGLRLFEGRMLFEVRPPLDVHKGTAFRALVTEYKLDAAVYIGDDTTDVDAFQAARDLREAGLCYAFGLGVTSDETPLPVLETADFLVEGISGVEAFLDWLLKALSAS